MVAPLPVSQLVQEQGVALLVAELFPKGCGNQQPGLGAHGPEHGGHGARCQGDLRPATQRQPACQLNQARLNLGRRCRQLPQEPAEAANPHGGQGQPRRRTGQPYAEKQRLPGKAGGRRRARSGRRFFVGHKG